jgi:16S rRNA processing protein RimM
VADELVIGRVIGPFGVRGELRLAVVDPDALHAGVELDLRLEDGDRRHVTITSVRRHGKGFVAHLEGYDDPTSVGALRGARLIVARERLPSLSGGAYREADLIGLQVIDAKLGPLGEVTEVRRYPSCDMLVVGARPILVPMLHAYNLCVNTTKRTIRVNLPDGFEELT